MGGLSPPCLLVEEVTVNYTMQPKYNKGLREQASTEILRALIELAARAGADFYRPRP